MSSSNISEKVLEKIKNEKVEMKPKWRFLASRYLISFLAVLFLAIGSVSIALIMELTSQAETFSFLGHRSGPRLMMSSLPYIWIILLIVFLALGIAEFLRTRRGYKYKLSQVAAVFLASITLLGWSLYHLGMAEKIENYLENRIFIYSHMTKTPAVFWSQPEEGLVSGVIMENNQEDKALKMQDWEEEIWEIDYSQALVRPRVLIQKGEAIKIIGEKTGRQKFRAEEIRPWQKCPMCQGGYMRRMR